MKFKLSITLLSILGISSLGYAEPQAQESVSIATPKADTKDSEFKNAVNDLKVSGFGFARYFGIAGKNGSGFSQQYRIKLDVTTGKVYGYSVTGGIFFSQGSSTPDLGSTTNSAVQGSRGTAYNDNFSDRFNIATIYGSKEFSINSTKTQIDLGKLNLNTPFNDKTLDLATGGQVNIKQSIDGGEMRYYAGFFDSWMSDSFAYNIRRLVTGDTGQMNAASLGIGNNLSLVGASGKLMKGDLSFQVYGGNIWRLFNFIGFGDVAYKFSAGDNKFGILAQVATAFLNSDRRFLYVDKPNTFLSENSANTRGIYNLQFNYKLHKFSAKLGYLGSFGDGYGVLLDYKGGIDTAGKIWNGNMDATYDGLGAFGAGGFKGSSINVAYLAASYGINNVKVGLDVAYVFGNTHVPLLKVTDSKAGSFTESSRGSQNFTNANFVEITPSITYNFTKKFEISLLAAGIVGDINFFKTRAEMKYTF